MRFRGSDFLLQIKNGSDWVSCRSDRSTVLKIGNESCDVSNKGATLWRQLLDAGVRSADISASGLVTDNVAYGLLIAAAVNGAIVSIRIVHDESAEVILGNTYLVSTDRGGEYNTAETYSITLSSADVAEVILSTVQTPVISPNGGAITVSDLITITTSTPGASIWYTIDGTTPTILSLPFTAPFYPSDGSLTVKTFATAAGYNDSAVATAIFTVSAGDLYLIPGYTTGGDGSSIGIAPTFLIQTYSVSF